MVQATIRHETRHPDLHVQCNWLLNTMEENNNENL